MYFSSYGIFKNFVKMLKATIINFSKRFMHRWICNHDADSTLIIFELLTFIFPNLSPNFSENASIFVSSTLEDQVIFSPSIFILFQIGA